MTDQYNKKFAVVIISDEPQASAAYAEKLSSGKRYDELVRTIIPGEDFEDVSPGVYLNDIKDQIKEEFVWFTTPDISFDPDIFDSAERAAKNFPDQKLIALNLDHDTKHENKSEHKPRIIYTADEKDIQLFPFAYFYSAAFLNNIKAEPAYREEADKPEHISAQHCLASSCREETLTMLLLDALSKTDSIIYAEDAFVYSSEDISAKPADYYGCRNKDFYTHSINNFYIPFLEKNINKQGKIPLWLMRSMAKLLFFKFFSNYGGRDKTLLIDEEIDDFFSAASKVLQYIDGSVIMEMAANEKYGMPLALTELFMFLKYDLKNKNPDRSFVVEEGILYYLRSKIRYSMEKNQYVNVLAIDKKEGNVVVSAAFSTEMLYMYDPDALYAVFNGKRLSVKHLDIFAFDTCFGKNIHRQYVFEAGIPEKEFIKNGASLSFEIEINDQKALLPIRFTKPASKLNEKYRSSYWRIDKKHILTYSRHKLTVSRANCIKRLKNELALAKERAAVLGNKGLKKRIFKIRMVMFFGGGFLKRKNIILYFDKLYKAGDNGEYQFRYDHAHEKEEGVSCFYIINKDAQSYASLKKEFGNSILEYGSAKCKLYALAAKMIMATGPEIIEFCGFGKKEKNEVRDLFNAGLVCISHGLTIQKIAHVQNRLFDDTMFYTTCSKYEAEHIMQPVYGYSADQVAITGQARFDGLKNNDKKQILITPTWRLNLVAPRKARNMMRPYNKHFKESAYFRIYNRMINDSRIIETAKKTGYDVIFLIHPLMSAQIDDYDRNDYVKLIPADGNMDYEKILTESSLMITDYSGIQYDFAYMKKPVVYFQPKEVPARYAEGGMKFETMGFGPLTSDYDEAVKYICGYMENKCVMEEKYQSRVDDFFKYTDYGNCERIHEAAYSWMRKRQ